MDTASSSSDLEEPLRSRRRYRAYTVEDVHEALTTGTCESESDSDDTLRPVTGEAQCNLSGSVNTQKQGLCITYCAFSPFSCRCVYCIYVHVAKAFF